MICIKESKERILVTCALPYVNNVPHIGNIAGSHLPADIFARFCRLAGYETVFIGGSDEHGTPIEVSAKKLGVSPKELTDLYYDVHRKIYEWLDISYDNFSRTSLKEHHKTTQEFFKKVYNRGFITEGILRLPYCEQDRRVLPDRYVEGTCPKCGYDGARGDQCENCSTLLNPDELKSPGCVICGTAPVFREVKHLFLNLDKLESELEEWIESNRGIWRSQVVNVAIGWINEGLKPRCITRDIEWGVKVPLEGFEDKVFYVWFDAPIGYISSTKEWAKKIGKPDEWKKFWQEKDSKIFHFIGKDNIPFHTIFWPGMLMANGEYTLPYRVAGLQYLNYEGDKISKSRKWGIFCENLPDAGLGSDIWRYYLTLLIPEINDTQWRWKEFQERVNNELVASLGNFVYRTLSFIKDNFDGVVPEGKLLDEDREVMENCRKSAAEFEALMWDIHLRDAFRKVFAISDIGNRYFQANEPWKLVNEANKRQANLLSRSPKLLGGQEREERAMTVLFVCANLCYDIAVLLSPFMPKSAREICNQLGVPLGSLGDAGTSKIKPGQRLNDVAPLFPKLKDEDIKRLKKITSKVTGYEDMFKKEEKGDKKDKEKARVSYDEFRRFEFRTAVILEASTLKNADRLLKLKIDVGGREKQVIAGIARHYDAGELIGKTVVVIDNLEPAVIRGEKSEGMLLAAVTDDKISLLTVDRDVESGSRVM